jgi:hypothetical protein
MEPTILDSARTRGIPDEDMQHAYRQYIDVWEREDDLTMYVGPDRSGRLLEIGVAFDDNGDVFIVHSMSARPKFLR